MTSLAGKVVYVRLVSKLGWALGPHSRLEVYSLNLLKFIINTLGEKYYEQTATKRRHSMPAGAWAGAQPQL